GVSSSSGTTSIATRLDNFVNASGTAMVFDLQGRYLGTLQLERNALESALRAKFKTSGAYLVRLGRTFQRVNVN
ncbi:MAG: pectate lyase, partial [Fibrobacter sp.]|nr:pectate lyase [Fibrobacter sp.]